MSGLIDAVILWPTFILILVVFGFAPGAVLRLLVLAFPRDDLRRRELHAELHAVPRIERPFWVAEQLEVALFEGLRERLARASTRRETNRLNRWVQVEIIDGDLRVINRSRRSVPVQVKIIDGEPHVITRGDLTPRHRRRVGRGG